MSSSSATPPPLGLRKHSVPDQRQSDRHGAQLAWSVRCGDSDEVYACVCENIGVGGLRMRAAAQLPPGTLKVGTRVELRGTLPELEDDCVAVGVVRWVDRGDERLAGVAFETGLRAREVWAINRMRQAA